MTGEDLVREALRIPVGCFKEVYVKKGRVSFSSPLTGNPWARDPTKRVGILEALNVNSLEGFFLRDDGNVEIEDIGEEKGQFYDKVKIVDMEEAVKHIGAVIDNAGTYTELLHSIDEAQRLEHQRT